ncbi:MAG: prolipoprotein diacylglyceryl transferase family protein [Pirellulales bacterium]
MYQTLFHIPREVAGVPMFGWGVLLALWAACSVTFLAWLIRRQGFNADTRGYVPVLALLGAAIAWLLPALSDQYGLPIRGFGTMMLVSVLAGVALAAYRARRVGLDPEIILSLAFWLFVGGIVGARVFYILEYWQDYRRATLGETLRAMLDFTKGGLVVFGSVIGAGAALTVFVRRNRLPFFAVTDLIAPSLALGLALGRVGCLMNGCCFGGHCELPWAVRFPWGSPVHVREVQQGDVFLHGIKVTGEPEATPIIHEVEPGSEAAFLGLKPGDRIRQINGHEIKTVEDAQRELLRVYDAPMEAKPISIAVAGDPAEKFWVVHGTPPRSLPVHPTQIYSAIDAFVLCLFLLAYYPFRRREGTVTALLITIHPITRFLLEIIRVDETSFWGTGLSISQNVSIVFLVVAAGLWVYLWWQPRGLVFGNGPTASTATV